MLNFSGRLLFETFGFLKLVKDHEMSGYLFIYFKYNLLRQLLTISFRKFGLINELNPEHLETRPTNLGHSKSKK